jgi:hypothetical protein
MATVRGRRGWGGKSLIAMGWLPTGQTIDTILAVYVFMYIYYLIFIEIHFAHHKIEVNSRHDLCPSQ